MGSIVFFLKTFDIHSPATSDRKRRFMIAQIPEGIIYSQETNATKNAEREIFEWEKLNILYSTSKQISLDPSIEEAHYYFTTLTRNLKKSTQI